MEKRNSRVGFWVGEVQDDWGKPRSSGYKAGITGTGVWKASAKAKNPLPRTESPSGNRTCNQAYLVPILRMLPRPRSVLVQSPQCDYAHEKAQVALSVVEVRREEEPGCTLCQIPNLLNAKGAMMSQAGRQAMQYSCPVWQEPGFLCWDLPRGY